MFNYERLSERKNSEKFNNFLKDNKGKVFTAAVAHPYEIMYTLKEDKSEPKWLFHYGDLIEIGDDNGT